MTTTALKMKVNKNILPQDSYISSEAISYQLKIH